MLAGEAVVAIWNGIAPEARDEFYAWHLKEHIPERVGIPGFRRGRRYVAITPDTQPDFFTLYETDTIEVIQGSDYTNRLNAPTPWTQSVTKHFRDTARSLARVLESHGPGVGGVLLAVRFDADAAGLNPLRALVREAAGAARVCGAHLCAADTVASGARTAESEGRTDIQAPPNWFALIEATDADAVAKLLPQSAIIAAGARGPFHRGIYRLEHMRLKTAFSS